MAARNGGERHMNLGDLLPAATLKAIEPIMNDLQRRKIDISEGKRRLLEKFEPLRADLEKKGVLADYLAWYLAYVATRGGGELGRVQVGDRR